MPSADVGAALGEELHASDGVIRLHAVLHAPSPEAGASAEVLVDALYESEHPGAAVSGGTPDGTEPSAPVPAVAEGGRPPGTVGGEHGGHDSQPGGAGGQRGTADPATRREPAPSRAPRLPVEECQLLDPAEQRSDETLDQLRERVHALLKQSGEPSSQPSTSFPSSSPDRGADSTAIALVGHQPGLSHLSATFNRPRRFSLSRWHAGAVPIDKAEVVCLEVRVPDEPDGRWSGHVLWTLHPGDAAALESVRKKIESKMETAKVLSAVITLMLTALLGVLLDAAKWQALARCPQRDPDVRGCLSVTPFGVDAATFSGQLTVQVVFALLLVALALFVTSMYAYDSLLMPVRFWAESPPRRGRDRARAWLPRRPPSSSAWVLYRNMLRVWFLLFMPATVLVATALTLLAVALTRLDAPGYVIATAVLVLLVLHRRFARPVLGSED
ncbi:hypothetical protein [Kineococcus aurantiacus]|uniref:Phosphohistidine phosphatase SixA n=1 Tax=Kineococcus aurantiacus TaxID=37633 RepID=A0A7Y9DQ16_9ACTN|nr:hypothetical protein [Kineococcus aurantiacus]NYD24679.1 phosphohistidine phosphatase SixA [Kineococcus aurantiacus]